MSMFHSFPLYIILYAHHIQQAQQYARVAIKINRDDAIVFCSSIYIAYISDDDELYIYIYI